MKKEKVLYYDYMRAFAVILVVSIHNNEAIQSLDIHSFAWVYNSFVMGVQAVAVPLFVMISGALLLGKDLSLQDFFKKRFNRVLIPFLFWSIVVYLLYLYWGEKELGLTFFSDLMQGNIHGVYWYIYMLLGIYFCVPILNKFILAKDIILVRYFLCMCAVSAIIMVFYPLFKIDLSFWGYYLGFFVLGYYISTYGKAKTYFPMCLIFIIYLILQSCLRYNNIPISYVQLLIPIPTTIVFFIFKQLTPINNKLIKNIILSIAKYSYGIYLVHILFISFFARLGFDAMIFGPYLSLPLLVILDIIGSMCLLWILNKIPIIRHATGIQ